METWYQESEVSERGSGKLRTWTSELSLERPIERHAEGQVQR